MKKLKKCPRCNAYTLNDLCKNCKTKTEQAGSKFIRKYSQ
ncbi:MAG: nucleolar RNA-binding Nop10p family protein [archaeon]